MKTELPIYIIIIPFAAAFILSCLAKLRPRYRKFLVLLATGIPMALTFFMLEPVRKGVILSYWLGNWQPLNGWAIGIGMAVDPLSLFMAVIIGVSTFLSGVYSFRYLENDHGVSKYYTLFLLLTGAMFAFVFSADLFNMYVFLEVMTVAAISLTIFREHKSGAIEAGFKYLITGTIGSSLVLLGVILLYSATGTLNLAQIGMKAADWNHPVVIFAFASLLTGFGVKGFLVPLHTWPPDAHMSAPSSISMILSGVLSKTGVYALIRVLYFVFQAMHLPAVQMLVIVWGVLTMVVGVIMALLQHDFKRLLAFHSVSQIGYIITALGLGTIFGATAGLYHLLNHVLFKCLLFLAAGAVLYRTHTTNLSELGGLVRKMPWTFTFFTVGAFSISGIPPFNGFASKWMIYKATAATGFYPVTMIAILVSTLTLASFVKVLYSAFLRKPTALVANISEAPFSMLLPMGLLSVGCIITGLFPEAVIEKVLSPVAGSLFVPGQYYAALFGHSFLNIGPTFSLPVFWQPLVWLLTFFLILVGLLFFVKLSKAGPLKSAGSLSNESGTVFTGGESAANSNPGADDLYWGLKHVFAPLFNWLRKAHSGVINDYAGWIVWTVVIVNLYLLIAL
jgi:multicomponent Na+:H+ antiporter subunit D